MDIKVGDKVRVNCDQDAVRTVVEVHTSGLGVLVAVDPPAMLQRVVPVRWVQVRDIELVQAEPVPRAWEMPAEPGPEVTAVRTAGGVIWYHGCGEWRDEADEEIAASWSELLTDLGPLTDATGDVDAAGWWERLAGLYRQTDASAEVAK